MQILYSVLFSVVKYSVCTHVVCVCIRTYSGTFMLREGRLHAL